MIGQVLPMLVDGLEEAIVSQPPEAIDEWLGKASAFLLDCRSQPAPAEPVD